jgi:hypothetical protein
MISKGLWPACLPSLNPCDFYLWCTLKDKVYMNNPWSLQKPKENIGQKIFIIPRH